MKKLFTLLFTFALFTILMAGSANAQVPVTVTNPTNTTPNLLATYPSLAAALTDLNLVTAMTGPVTLTLTGGNSETTPPTGLIIGSATLNPVLSATNSILINTTGIVTLNAGVGTATPGSAAPDGILAIVGADYITIDGLTFTDGNTTNPATMEFGVGLFKLSASDGAQYNTIKNCTFNMQRVNNASGTSPMVEGSVGILVINSVNTAATTVLTPLSAAGTNSYNKFYTNIINGGNYGIALSGYAAATPFTLGDTGNDIGGSSSGQGNQILNFGGAPAAANPSAGIRANNQWGINISYNMINNNNGGGVNHPLTLRGIYAQAGTSANATITYNNVTVKGGGTTSQLSGIENAIGSTAAGNTVNINNNTVTGAYTTATTGAFYTIYNSASAATVNINNNNISSISTPGTGSLYGIYTGSPGILNVNNNTISALNKTGIGYIYGIYFGTPTTSQTALNNILDGLTNTAASNTSYIYGFYTGGSATVENFNNNTLKNFSTTGAAYVYGMRIYSGTGNKTLQGNQIYNLSVTGGGTIYGINKSYGLTDDVSGNSIYNLQVTGATTGGYVYGLYNTAGTTLNIYNNQIYGLSVAGGTSGTVYGLYNTVGAPANLYKNNIYNLSSAGTSTPLVYGLYIGGGTTNYVYNNFVSDLRTPASGAAISLVGIYASGGTTDGFYYNSVYMNAASTGALFGSSAFYASTTPTVDLRNNIFVNVSTPVGATGFTTAYRRSTTTLTTYSANSNNNDLYAGTPGVNNLIMYDGTNSYQTIAAYKTAVSPRDAASFSELAPFVNVATTPYDLHLNTITPTQCESGGVPISTPIAITTDYDGQTRNAVTPDVGADEGNFTGLDLNPPNISYTPLGNTSGTGSRVLTTTISDYTGVPTVGIGLPVLYWKINAGAYSGVQGVWVSGTTYSFTFGAGVVLNDVVSYYVCAQDLVGTPNVGGYPAGGSGYTANPPAAGTPTTTPSTYLIVDVPLSGDYTVGSTMFNKVTGKNITFDKVTKKVIREEPIFEEQVKGKTYASTTLGSGKVIGTKKVEVDEISWVPMENGKVYNGPLYVKKMENPNLNYPANINGIYATITAAVADLNLRGVSGATRFLLNDAVGYTTGETFPITINQVAGASSTNTITIKPNTGVTTFVSSATATALFKLNGADYVTIDGSNGTTSKDLTLTNTNTALSTAVWIASASASDGATFDVVKNCLINGSSPTTTTAGVLLGSGTTMGNAPEAPNTNITIQNNTITAVQNAVYHSGFTTSPYDQNISVTGNLFGSATAASKLGYRGMIFQNVQNFTASGNTIMGVITATTSSATATGIQIGGVINGGIIDKNKISDVKQPSTSGWGSNGIYLGSTSTAANIKIDNNFISDVASYGYSGSGAADNGYGMYIYSGGGYNIYYKSINLTTNQTSTSGITAAINLYSSGITTGGIDLRDNIFANSQTVGAALYSVYCASANTIFSDINYNDYYTLTGPNLGYLTTTQANLAAWKIATGKDVNSVSGDPKFQSATDLHIKSSEISPVSDAGTPIAGITTDIDNDTRNVTTPDIGADEYTYIPPSVLDPNPFTATAINSREIDLAWALNANNDPIIIATNSTSTFGVPITSKEYFVSDPLAGGGTIIYKGTDLAFAHTLLNYATPYYYRAFSFDVSFNYSPGIDANATTALPDPPATFTATSISQTQIDLGWTRNVNNNDVIVATNSTSTFGSPVNGTVYNASDPITGGGTVIYRGPLLAFNHTGLTGSTTYFYKSWSVDGAVGYSSAGLTANATTQCAPITSFPWNESFEGVVIPAFPPCWFKENGDYVTTNNANSPYDADARTGTQFLRESWSATNEYMWTPGFELTAGTPYNFSFWWAGDGYSGWTGDVFYNTTQISTGATQLGSSFVIDGTVTTKTYAQVLHSFTPGVTGVYYFAIRVNCPTSNPWYLSFDDFSLDAATAPQLSVDPGSLAFGYVPYPGTSTTKTYSLSGSNLTTGPIVVTAPAGFEVSLDGSAWSSTVNVTYTPPTLAPTTIYAHFVPLAGGTAYSGNITNVGGGATDVKLANTNTKISNTDTKSGNTNTKSGNTKDKLAGGANVAVTGSSLLSYCVPTYLYGGSTDFMTQVTLGTLSQATASNTSPYYIDYRTTQNAIPELVQGSSNNLYITFSSDANQYNGVWIDFDHNGTFDATEFFSSNTNAGSGGTATVVITVPGGAALGQTVMRLRGGDDYQPLNTQACGASSSSYGQGQDYWVNITVPLPNDVGAYSIDFVPSTPTGAQIPKATIKNFGTAIQSVAFNTNMTIEPGGYSSTVANTPPMVSGATEQLSFASWTPTAGVLYTVKITTLLGTDANPANDTLTKWTMAFSGTWTSGATSATSDYLGSGVGYTEVVNKATTGYLFRIGGGDAGTACFKYNVNTNTWTTIASLPVVRMMNATAVVGNYVYCIGGSDGVSTTNYVSTVYKYDINNDAGGWVAVAPVPIEIAWCKAVGYNNHIYLVGGVDNPSATGVTLTSVYVYDALLNTWAAGTSLPLPRMGGAFSNAGNTLVYVGGSDDVSTVNTALRGVIDGGNPLLITWTTSLAPYPGNGREYFNSSNKSDRTSLAPVIEKNSNVRKIKSNNNSPNSTYPAGSIYRVDAAPWGTDGVIIAYGSPSWTWAPLIPNPCYVYKPATDTWVKQPDVPISTCAGYLGSVDLGGTWKLIVNGGIINGSGGRTNATQILTDILSSPLNLGLTAMLSGQCNGTTMNYTKDVTVELHNSTTPYALVESQAVTLSTSGTANPVFTLAANGTPYYIVIKSNNGLETWSATPQTFTGSALSYDFTTAATQAFGSNMLLVGTKWCIITGDANQDGSIDAADRSLCWNERNLSGIYATDFNGDGSVDAADRSIAWNNRNKGVAKPALALSPVRGAKQEINKSNAKGTFDLRLDGTNSKKVTKTK